MRNKLILAVIGTIGLSSFVVLGSSPGLVGGLLESVKNNSVASVFSGMVESVTPIEISLNTDQPVSPQIPEAILWSVIFSLPERLDSEAEKAKLAGQDESLWTNYFIRQAKLSTGSSQTLRETAARYFVEVAPLDEQAGSIVRDMRAKNPQPQPPPFSADTILPTELTALQNQKDEVVLRNRDSFRTAIGEEEFAKFSEFLLTEFAKGFVRRERRSDEPFTTPRSSENNGFAPTERAKTRGNQ